jgi:hypothetical protein
MNEKIVEILKAIFHGQFACSLPSPSNGGCEIFSREGSNFYCPSGFENGLASKKLNWDNEKCNGPKIKIIQNKLL